MSVSSCAKWQRVKMSPGASEGNSQPAGPSVELAAPNPVGVSTVGGGGNRTVGWHKAVTVAANVASATPAETSVNLQEIEAKLAGAKFAAKIAAAQQNSEAASKLKQRVHQLEALHRLQKLAVEKERGADPFAPDSTAPRPAISLKELHKKTICYMILHTIRRTCKQLVAVCREEHTLVGVIAPPDDFDEQLTPAQNIQMFFNALVLELMLL
eukprot:6122097-Prymnesium_polylepis.1